jgi:threo-3-hydroxy-L-aspartate ammonia-lyase
VSDRATTDGRPVPIEEIRRAARTIADEATRTPVLTDTRLDPTGGAVHLKVEAFQRAGSFKFRGAFNRLSRIPDAERGRGVVAVSSGNHGAAVACAAGILGMAATVYIPDDAPEVKRSLIAEFGADIVTFERAVPDREAAARAHAARTGATFVHPFEDPLVMAGQGTVALELVEDVGDLDVVLVPMSGGGLMAGCASAAHALAPGCRMIGVEPALADDTRRSFAAGELVAIETPPTIADGLAVTMPGARTFAINRRLVADVLAVSEAQIVEAMRTFRGLFGRLVEPSGAVGLAALAADPERWSGLQVGIVISGGNIDADRFERLTGGAPADRPQ